VTRTPRIPRPLRLFALLGALLAVSLSATACDTSPYAAKVNSDVIKSSALNAELAAWAGNKAYVSDFDSNSSSSSSSGTGTTVAGDALGTYNTTWVAGILTDMIAASAVHQHLAASGQLPGPELLAAARSLYQSVAYWGQFSPDFRDTLTQRLAEEATFVPIPTGSALATVNQGYQQLKQYFYNEVCVREASTFDQAAAQAITTSGSVTGTTVCYTPIQLEDYPADFRNALMSLKVGDVSQPIKTNYGYQVVQVVSRQEQGFNPSVQKVLALVSGSAPDALTSLLRQAVVSVNPAYGSWNTSQITVDPPRVPSLPS
jgi:hypothetical protein